MLTLYNRYFLFYQEMKKLLQKNLGLKPHKLKPLGPKTAAMFIAFKNEDDRTEAILKLNGYRWKKNVLSAFVRVLHFLNHIIHASKLFCILFQASSAAPDPYMKRMGTEPVSLPTSQEGLDAAIRKQTIPLFGKPYEEQVSQN